MYSLAETKTIVKNIDGWLLEKEQDFLYWAAKNCKGKGVIVEIGSWKGKSTICLANGSKTWSNIKIYAIDPHIGGIEHQALLNNKSSFEQFRQNIRNAKVDDIVFPIVKTSQEAAKNWNQKIEFLWIDGDHSYEGAKSDFDLYNPYVVDGGLIAFHDSTQGDVNRVVYEVFSRDGFSNIKLVDSIVCGYKRINSKKRIKDKIILGVIKNYNYFRKFRFLKFFKKIFEVF